MRLVHRSTSVNKHPDPDPNISYRFVTAGGEGESWRVVSFLPFEKPSLSSRAESKLTLSASNTT